MVNNQGDYQPDILEVTDDAPTIVLGPKLEDIDEEEVPHFYLSLNVHDMILHNAMIEFCASHNLIPRVVVEILRLEITRTYKYLYSFDSRKVIFLGLIKYMVVTITQRIAKSIVMDFVVAEIPPIFGMLFSRYWASNLKGILQMDMSYTTIQLFGG